MRINLEEIPVGYRFNPTDEEIITYYLRAKVEGVDMTWFSHVINEQDLYSEPPWVIFDHQDRGGREDDRIRYFYTRLKKKHESGKKIHRTIGKNKEYCWGGQDKGANIYDHQTMTVIGMRKQYTLIRSDKKKCVRDANSNTNKRKIMKGNDSKDIHKDDGRDKSFGHWIMHEYSLVNPRSSKKQSSSKDDNQNYEYVLCRIRMKSPPKPTTSTTTGRNIATTHRHDHSINSTTKPALPSCNTSITTHGYQNMSNQMLHDQQPQDHLTGTAHVAVAVPPSVPIGADYQINHQDQGYLWQHPYDDQLFQQDMQQQQLVRTLMYDQEQPAVATMEVSMLGLLSNSMVDQAEEENRFMLNNGGGGHGGGGGTTSDHLDYSTTMATGGIDNLDDGWTGLDDSMMNYDTIMNSLKEDTFYNDLIWENDWACPFPPSQPSGS